MQRTGKSRSWRGLKGLWDHQAEALELLENYLSADREKAALIHMPTGAGKSGVIAALAQCMPRVRHALLLTPWTTLRRQLRDDVDVNVSGFWKMIEGNRSKKPVLQMWPSLLRTGPRGSLKIHSRSSSDCRIEEAG